MKATLHKADTRGSAEHGWLSSQHTFSFANYHDPQRMGFGMLRVINDDVVQAGMALVLTRIAIWKSLVFPCKGY